MEQYDGLADITGARLEYTVVGSGRPTDGLDVNRHMGTLTGLNPFTSYNISLFMRNRLGLSDPVSLTQRTRSSKWGINSDNIVNESNVVTCVFNTALLE